MDERQGPLPLTPGPYTILVPQTSSGAGEVKPHLSGRRGLRITLGREGPLTASQQDGGRQQGWGWAEYPVLCPMNWSEEVTRQVRRLLSISQRVHV